MEEYEKDALRDTAQEERIVEEIHAAALRKVQLSHPEIEVVADGRTIDDYCDKHWDYPGAWYSRGFKLPEGFHSKDELIDAIAEETIRIFTQRKQPRKRTADSPHGNRTR